MYLLLLLVGSIGFLAMVLLGFSHGVGTHVSHAGGGGHVTVGAHGPGVGGHHIGGSHSAGRTSSSPRASTDAKRSFPVWLMVSPLDIFSFCLGAGAAGQIAHAFVSAAMLPWIALIGAIVFNVGMVKPAMAFMMKFVSKPSEGLEGAVARTAEAVTNFDEKGRGLVKICLDDQVVQVLATLEDADIHHGVKVNKGDEVVVVEVDSAKNTCRVSKEL